MDLFVTSENTHCPLFFLLSHSPLMGGALTKSQTLRVPSGKDFASGVMQKGGESVGDPHCPKLAKSALVSRHEGEACGSPLSNSAKEGPAVSSKHPSPELLSLHVWLLQGS